MGHRFGGFGSSGGERLYFPIAPQWDCCKRHKMKGEVFRLRFCFTFLCVAWRRSLMGSSFFPHCKNLKKRGGEVRDHPEGDPNHCKPNCGFQGKNRDLRFQAVQELSAERLPVAPSAQLSNGVIRVQRAIDH